MGISALRLQTEAALHEAATAEELQSAPEKLMTSIPIQELVSSDAAELHLRDPIFRSRLFPALAERFIQDITSAKGGNV